ncbi:MAG: hypothetical protein P4L46_01635 [Fimbriimonas sp.]|nr:hypothetical protein [Fimbriimonas sp.]
MSTFDAYLYALDRMLARHLSPDRRERFVEEVRSHLTMDASDRERAGLDPGSAARLAKQAVGAPRVLAAQMIRQARGYDTANPVRLTVWFGIAFILSLSVPMWLMVRMIDFASAEEAIHWLPFFVLLGFGALVLRTRRWLVWPMAMWSACAAAAMLWAGLIPAMPNTSARAVAELRSELAKLGQDQQYVRACESGRMPTNKAPVPEGASVAERFVPGCPFNIPVSSKRTYTLAVVNPTQAAMDWGENGTAYAQLIDDQIQLLRDSLDIQTRPTKPAQFHWGAAVTGIAFTAGESTLLFLLVNGLALWASSASIRRRNQRDPLLA